jgi:uncharacterized protein (UPF0248 family)
MITIRELLNRIRWDRDYARGDFSVGYYDRLEERIILVPFATLEFDPDDHFSFRLVDADGQDHTIPLHRVYEVYHNGECIWRREHR